MNLADECEKQIMDFYLMRLEEGNSLKDIDEMDIIYFMQLVQYKTEKDERKIIEEYDSKGL